MHLLEFLFYSSLKTWCEAQGRSLFSLFTMLIKAQKKAWLNFFFSDFSPKYIHCPRSCLSQADCQLSRKARKPESHTAPGPAKPVFKHSKCAQQNLTDHDDQEVITQALMVSRSEQHTESVSKGLWQKHSKHRYLLCIGNTKIIPCLWKRPKFSLGN